MQKEDQLYNESPPPKEEKEPKITKLDFENMPNANHRPPNASYELGRQLK